MDAACQKPGQKTSCIVGTRTSLFCRAQSSRTNRAFNKMIPRVCLLVVSCLCSFTHAFPLADSSDAVVIDYKTDTHTRFEQGQPGKGVSGSYSWVNDDKIYQVDYTADENGYRPRLSIKSLSKSKSELKPVVQKDTVVAQSPSQKKPEGVQPTKEVGVDAVVIEIPVAADVPVQEDSAQGTSQAAAAVQKGSVQATSQADAPVQKDSVQATPQADAAVQKDGVKMQADQVKTDKEVVTHDVVAPGEPVAETSKAELPSEIGKSKPSVVIVADDVKIPAVSDPIVQQADSQDKVQTNTEEVKPDQLIVAQELVVNVPAQLETQQDNSQSQAASLEAMKEVEPVQQVVNEDVANIESIPDVEESAQGVIIQDVPLSQHDAQEMILEIDPSMFDVQPEENATKDEIYTDDAVIVDAAIDPLSLGVLDNINQWDQVQSQDEASSYLNAMLMEYANQMYGNAKPQAEIEEKPEIQDEQPEPFYYQDEVDDSALEYQRATVDDSNHDAYSISFDRLYNSFLHHLQVAKEYRARSKVDDDIDDQEEASQDLQSAFRLLVDVAEQFSQQLPIPEKEIAQIQSRSGSHDHSPADAILEELYYQKWLAEQQPMYYIVYPETDDYYR
ncbi:uncharacterized protein LOC130688817 [Daphnia carinata]|uniref:uncharacterized protein LOC130688817 n=1 Tax=Daphnia carinata TaxID=120202 RepID=UPI00257A8F8B|nr:uncharacterized protein LOC130688817 [Daphnia carinata]